MGQRLAVRFQSRPRAAGILLMDQVDVALTCCGDPDACGGGGWAEDARAHAVEHV